MNRSVLMALLPHAVLAAGVVAALLLSAFARSHRRTALAAGAALALALWASVAALSHAPVQATALLLIDRTSSLFSSLVLLLSLGVVFLAYPYLERQAAHREEFYLLLLLAVLGGITLPAASHFAAFFFGIELLTVPVYALAGYLRGRERSIEAGFKYLILGGAASAFLLFGIALLYAGSGSLSFGPALAPQPRSPLFSAGIMLLLGGIGFKLALVPFHLWTPDVYEGAPAPVVAFAASASKAAVVAALLRITPPSALPADAALSMVVTVLAVASMVLGTLLAIGQNSVKRMLAYSSISHYGTLLAALPAGGPATASVVMVYLVSYSAAVLAAFGVVALLSDGDEDADDLSSYTGLARRRPWLAAALGTALLSLLGLPPTAGFIAKFLVIAANVEASRLPTALAVVGTSAVAAYYYLRIIMAMVVNPEEAGVRVVQSSVRRTPVLAGMTVFLAAGVLLWIGVAPAALLDWLARL